MKLLILLTLLIAPSPEIAVEGDLGRIAIIADGNDHDEDDIGATPMSMALLAAGGAQSNLVYYGHSSHVGGNIQSQHNKMIQSANGNLAGFGISSNVVFDEFAQPTAAQQALAAQINASSAGDKLTVIQAGPWETLARAFDIADPVKHRHVRILTHSDWNDDHIHPGFPNHRNRYSFFAQYEGGIFGGVQKPRVKRIANQNNAAFRSNLFEWNWMAEDPNLSFVLNRTTQSGIAQGDMSDAGMVFWYMTGNQFATMGQIKNFFKP